MRYYFKSFDLNKHNLDEISKDFEQIFKVFDTTFDLGFTEQKNNYKSEIVDDNLSIKLELAGLSKKDINIKNLDKTLVVKVEGREDVVIDKLSGYDYSTTKAKMKNGLLELIVQAVKYDDISVD